MKSLSAHTQYESLKNKKVLISGGTTGLGRAIALRLSAEGAKVFIFGRHQEQLDDALRDIRQNDPGALGMVADASRREDLRRVFEMVDESLGGIDVLISNAALGAEDLKSTPDDEREYVLATNIAGYLTCCRLAMLRMREHSHIILMGSVTADNREPGGSIYVATKAAIQGFSESFRQEAMEQGIKVSLIQPGKTGSDMVDASPEEERESEKNLEMLKAEDIAVCVEYILTQPRRCTVSQITVLPAREPKES
ncbi:MAG: SDR family oxidoreductase [Verrucomicrobiota bacterium]